MIIRWKDSITWDETPSVRRASIIHRVIFYFIQMILIYSDRVSIQQTPSPCLLSLDSFHRPIDHKGQKDKPEEVR